MTARIIRRHGSIAMRSAAIAALLAGLGFPRASNLTGQEIQRWHIEARPWVEIGKTEGDPNYLFHAIASGRFLPAGQIAVADAGYLNVRIFDADGTFDREMGGEGEGPGEFRSIEGMWVTPDTLIAIWDPTNRRFTKMDLEGTVRHTAAVHTNMQGNLEVFFGTFSTEHVVLAALRLGRRAPTPTPDVWSLARFDLNGTQLADLGEVAGMRRANGNPVPFSAMPHVAVRGDLFFVADGYGPEIHVQDSRGALIRTIELPSRDVPADQMWTSLESALVAAGNKQLFLEYLHTDRVPRDDRFPEIAGLLVDEGGLLWVKRYDDHRNSIWLKKHPLWPAPGGEWIVIQPDTGALVAKVTLPSDVRPLQIQADRLLGVRVDENGVERIVVHGIRK